MNYIHPLQILRDCSKPNIFKCILQAFKPNLPVFFFTTRKVAKNAWYLYIDRGALIFGTAKNDKYIYSDVHGLKSDILKIKMVNLLIDFS